MIQTPPLHSASPPTFFLNNGSLTVLSLNLPPRPPNHTGQHPIPPPPPKKKNKKPKKQKKPANPTTQAYVDFLIGSRAAPPQLHDEFFLLLLTALLAETPSSGSGGSREGKGNDNDKGQGKTGPAALASGDKDSSGSSGSGKGKDEGALTTTTTTELGALYQERLREFLRASTQVGGWVGG